MNEMLDVLEYLIKVRATLEYACTNEDTAEIDELIEKQKVAICRYHQATKGSLSK